MPTDNLTHGVGEALPSFLSSRSKQGRGNVMCVCVCVSVYVRESAGAHQGQKRVLDPLKLELQVIVCCQAWVLGAELKSSTKGVQTLNLDPYPAPHQQTLCGFSGSNAGSG